MTISNSTKPNQSNFKIAKYAIGFILIFASIGAVAQSKFLVSLFYLIIGLVLIPPISEKIKENFALWQNKNIRYISYVVLFILAGAFIGKNGLKSDTSKSIKVEATIEKTSSDKNNLYNGNENKIQEVEVKQEEEMDNSDFWQYYSPSVKEKIHELIKNKDCVGLQNEFNQADKNNQAQLNRTGRTNADLMDFIDEKMIDLGCPRE